MPASATHEAHRQQWEEQGWIRHDALIDADRTARIRQISERVLAQWRLRSAETGRPGGFGAEQAMRHLNHPGYFRDDRQGLTDLLEFIADPKILDLVGGVFDDDVLLRCTSLFMNPLDGNTDGNWHRDTQFATPEEDKEKARIMEMAGRRPRGMQLQIALVPSSDCEYVPGSHLRWDTDAEYAIRLADNQRNNRSNHMPGAVRVDLRPGDAVAFNAAGLHRGRYHADHYRRTFMLTYTPASAPSPNRDYFSYQPWFLEPGYLDGLSDHATTFYRRYLDAFRDFISKPRDDTPS